MHTVGQVKVTITSSLHRANPFSTWNYSPLFGLIHTSFHEKQWGIWRSFRMWQIVHIFFAHACQSLIVQYIITGSDQWQLCNNLCINIYGQRCFKWNCDPFSCTGTSLSSLIWSRCVRNATRSSPWSWRRGWRSCLTLLQGSRHTVSTGEGSRVEIS